MYNSQVKTVVYHYLLSDHISGQRCPLSKPHFIYLCLAVGAVVASCGGCAVKDAAVADGGGRAVSRPGLQERVTLDEIAQIAAKCDSEYTDGWICGREPRVFKSPYGKLSPMAKAEFAEAYRRFIESTDQDLINRPSSYISYTRRAAFARKYWSESSAYGQSFKKESKKMQVAWVHESLWDGGELWWRAAEKRFGPKINSLGIMAHDQEQDMVFKFADVEGNPRNFADEYGRAPHVTTDDHVTTGE